MNIHDVLMHTTGLPGGLFPGNPIDDEFARALRGAEEGMTLEEITDAPGEHPLKFHPGTHWNYGLSTDIVGRLVEIISGDRFDDYLRREIFDPLGMVDTGFFVPEEAAERLTALYQFQPARTPALLETGQRAPICAGLLPLGRGRAGLDHGGLRRLLPHAAQRRPAGRPPILGRKTLELMTPTTCPAGRR